MFGFWVPAGGAGASGVDRLACAMLMAAVAALPFGLHAALPAFADPLLLAAAIGVGVSSSVIPYVCDQLAMARLPRASFALLLSLLPASAAVIGFRCRRLGSCSSVPPPPPDCTLRRPAIPGNAARIAASSAVISATRCAAPSCAHCFNFAISTSILMPEIGFSLP